MKWDESKSHYTLSTGRTFYAHAGILGLGPVETYLDITFRGKPAADGNKYKALGNSMAVPCMAWIGRRIKDVDSLDVALGAVS